MNEFGGSGIEKHTLDYILGMIPKGSTVIELGAGNVSTRELSKHYNLISIENNEHWCNLFPNVNYIHAPIVGGWYDTAKIQNLPKHEFVLIDGLNRKGILNNLDLFNPDAKFMIHDTYRIEERELAHELSLRLKRNYFINTIHDHFAVI